MIPNIAFEGAKNPWMAYGSSVRSISFASSPFAFVVG
jgi:hypothetical protein